MIMAKKKNQNNTNNSKKVAPKSNTCSSENNNNVMSTNNEKGMNGLYVSPSSGTAVTLAASSKYQSQSSKDRKQQQQQNKKNSIVIKQHMKEYEKQQMQRYNTMLYNIVFGYIVTVTTIVILYCLSSPKQVAQLLWSSSLASFKQETIVKMEVPPSTKSSSSSSSSSSSKSHYSNRNHQRQEQDFEEVRIHNGKPIHDQYRHQHPPSNGGGLLEQHDTTTTKRRRRAIKVKPQQQQQPAPQKHFQFQKGEIMGVAYFQCCTIHGFTDAIDARYGHNSDHKNHLPVGDLIMPSMLYSNDMIILGYDFFQRSVLDSLPIMGGDVVLTDKDAEHRAMFEYCLAAEQRQGLIDTIIVLDIESITKTSISHFTLLLQELLRSQRISALPIAALVTPHQSSDIVSNWILYDNHISLMKLVRHWIPVSAAPYLLQQSTTMMKQENTGGNNLHVDDDNSINRPPTNNSTTGTSVLSLLSKSRAFMEMEKWPIFVISSEEDMVLHQQVLDSLLLARQQHDPTTSANNIVTYQQRPVDGVYINHTIIRHGGCTTDRFYIDTPTDFMNTILQYYTDWEQQYPKGPGEMDDPIIVEEYNFISQ